MQYHILHVSSGLMKYSDCNVCKKSLDPKKLHSYCATLNINGGNTVEMVLCDAKKEEFYKEEECKKSMSGYFDIKFVNVLINVILHFTLVKSSIINPTNGAVQKLLYVRI